MDHKVCKEEKGTRITNTKFEVFFGNKIHTKSVFLSENSEGQLLKQIHGDTLIHTSKANNKNVEEADAHWTSTRDIALGIITADCLPIFAFDLEKEISLAIHAGWKGLEKYIILKSLHSLSFSQKILAFIGPHIQRPSFEIKNNVAEKLSALNKEAVYEKHNKKYADLNLIAKTQLTDYGIPVDNIYNHGDDTFSNNDYSSYRRGDVGKQISYIRLF